MNDFSHSSAHNGGEAKRRICDLNDIPPVRAYLAKIGARPRSLFTAVVATQEGGYSRTKHIIKFSRDGAVRSPRDLEPTKKEAAEIKAACAKVEWPQCIASTVAAAQGELKKLLAAKYGSFDPERLFVLQPLRSDHRSGDVLMAQYRVDHPSGGKSYYPWTFWDDNVWRQMEPKGLLPLYGLEQLRDHMTVFLHEGAKAARQWQRLTTRVEMQSALAAQPWGESLKYAAHLGWISGAHHPERTDWAALKGAGVERVFIVSDNDEPGLVAFEPIAEALHDMEVIHVTFPSDFPVWFDLADQWPERLWVERGGARRYVGPSFAERCKGIIKLKSGALAAQADEAERALINAEVQVFRRGDDLVRPIVEEVDAAHGRKTFVARLRLIDQVYLRDLLSRKSYWRKTLPKDPVQRVYVNPPLDVVQTVLARAGEWHFKPVAGVITCPTMRPDGTLLTEPGHDPATKLLLFEPPPMPPIPDKPMKDDALAALYLLKGLLTEFVFVDDVARATALSALITPVVRGAFPVAPMHVARAPVAGSGKSYLFDLVAAIATGRQMPVMAAGRNEEETEKRLGASLLTGQPLISIDNVNGELGGDALAQAVERPIVEIRVLGRSEKVPVEARSTSLFATGNNIIMVGDMCRRVLMVALDPKLERPELREFKADPFKMILDDRAKYVAAALTVCGAYVAAGRPDVGLKPLASFEEWSKTVRAALVWLGEKDPVKSMEVARAEDPELGALRAMLETWAETIGVGYVHRKTLQDVIATANAMTGGGGYDMLRPQYPALHAAVQATAKGRGAIDAENLGKWMRGRKGRPVGGLRFCNKPDPKGGSEWWIENLNAPDERASGKVDQM